MRETRLAELYVRLRYSTARFETDKYQTPVGEVELVVPADHKRTEQTYDWEYYEPGLIRALDASLSSETVFYDVGAHIGYVTKAALLMGVPAEQIHAFERVPFRYHTLELNCTSEGVRTVRASVSDEAEGNKTTLDEYAEKSAPPDVVKIDVEGAEYRVLTGTERVLSEYVPTIYLEVHPEQLAENAIDESDVFEFLEDRGYRLEFMNHRSEDFDWIDEPVYDTSTPSPTYLLKAIPQ